MKVKTSLSLLSFFAISAIIALGVTVLLIKNRDFSNRKVTEEMVSYIQNVQCRIANVEKLKTKIDDMRKDIIDVNKLVRRESTAFDLSNSDGFKRVDTSYGLPLLVSVENVTPYMGGYKVLFYIGNPHNVTFENLGADLSWWFQSCLDLIFRDDITEIEIENFQNERSKSICFMQSIDAGKWNSVEVTIPRITEEEAAHLTFKFNTSSTTVLLTKANTVVN